MRFVILRPSRIRCQRTSGRDEQTFAGPNDRHPPPRARRCRHGARTPLKDRPHRPPRRQWQPDQCASRRGAACKSTPRLSTTPLIRDDTFSRTTSEAAPSTPRRRTTPLPLVLPARLWREALEGLSGAISSRPPEAGVSKRPWRACRSARLDCRPVGLFLVGAQHTAIRQTSSADQTRPESAIHLELVIMLRPSAPPSNHVPIAHRSLRARSQRRDPASWCARSTHLVTRSVLRHP